MQQAKCNRSTDSSTHEQEQRSEPHSKRQGRPAHAAPTTRSEEPGGARMGRSNTTGAFCFRSS